MKPALQMPVERGAAKPLSRRLFRKTVLRVGRIPYEGRVLDFTKEYLAKVAQNFNAGAYEAVPFVLATDKNLHSMAPERVRGKVHGMELAGDRLDAIIELSEDGAQVVRDFPELGVSARIVEEVPEHGRPKAVPAIQHVCGTLDPRFPGLGDWQAIADLAANGGTGSEMGSAYSADQVVDLTAATYDMLGTDATDIKLNDEQKAKLKELGVPEDKYEDAAKIFAESSSATDGNGAGTSKDEPKDDPKDDPKDRRSFLSRLFGREVKEDEVEQIDSAVQALLPDEAKDEGKKDEPATANLSAEAQQAIDLATRQAASANNRADANDKELRQLRFERRRDELLHKGVEPAIVNLCKPVLELPDDAKVIDLSAAGGDKDFNVREFVDKLLEQHEGTVDLSAETGRQVAEDDDERTEAKRLADEMDEV